MKQKSMLFVYSIAILASVFISSSISSNSFAASTASMTTDSSITLDIVPANGGIAIDEASVNVVTTCRNGYNLTLATPNGSNLYLNGDGTGTAAFTAVNGTSTLANSTNKWGYTLTANASSSTVFSPLSATETTLKTASQTASQTDIDDTFSIYYGAKADNSITPGSYKMANNGALVYYLTMEPSCYTVDIAYDGNNADAGTMGAAGTGIIHTGVKDGDTVNLVASNFSRAGYGFAGWSFDSNAGAKLVDNDNTNNPVVYGPQEDVTLPTGFTNYDTDNDGIVKLYAVWIPAEKDGNNSPIYLQGWMGCSNLEAVTYDSNTGALDLTKNSITALTDQRDNEIYTIARLADGKCWMIENLRLDNNATVGNNQNDPTVTNEWLAEGYGKSTTYGDFVGLANPEIYDFDGYSGTNANSIYYVNGNQSGTAFIDIGSDSAGARMPRYNNSNTSNRASNPISNSVNNENSSGSLYSYGNYYTWHAALANLTPNRTTNQSTTGTSLCPVGWHLPTGGMAYASGNTGGINVTGNPSTFRDFYNLGYAIMGNVTAYESNASSGFSHYGANTTNPAGKTALAAFRSFPNNFLYSGYYRSVAQDGFSGGSGRGSLGYYWTSAAYNYNNRSEGSFNLNLSSSSAWVAPGTSWEQKHYGRAIRCLASDPTNYTLSYNANGGSGAPNSQVINNNGSAIFTLSSNTPTRSGYTFVGWANEKGNELQPGDTYKTKDVNTVLYAIWTNNSCNPTATTIGTGNTSTDAVCLQDVKPGMKTSLPFADGTTGTFNLIDARDGKSYTVAKLADGELWLTKNLNYGNSSDTLLTSYDTDLPSGKAFKAPATTTSFETANNDDSYVSPKILTDNTYGGYYSFAAAIASTETYSNSSQSITTSICPKGWDLPTNTQYDNLRSTSGNTTFAKMSAAPYSFIYAGYRNGTSFTSQTSTIRLWTSTNYSAPYAYYTTAYGLATYSSNYKRYGESVRCIASNGVVTVYYDGNGTTQYPVTGTTESQVDVEANITSVKSNGFTRNGWKFNGWNTMADGSGITVPIATSLGSLDFQGSNTMTLYAQWTPIYTITYVNNCMSWASSDSLCTATESVKTVVSSVELDASGNASTTLRSNNTFTMQGWNIKEWTTNADGTGTTYRLGNSYSITGANPGDGITLYTHWIPVYVVQYEDNGADNPNGMGRVATEGIVDGRKTIGHYSVSEGDSFRLFASNFKRAGYGFIGWSTDANAWSKLTDNDSSNDARIYGPNETFTAPPRNGPILHLYAIWAPAETNGGSPVYLQNWTGCASMTATTYNSSTGKLTVANNTVTALTDERDGEVYAIAKLADGNCWMMENLRLADVHKEGNNTVTTTLTTSNTNIDSNNSTLPITNIYNADPALATKSNHLSPSSDEAFNATTAPYGWCSSSDPDITCHNQSRLNSTNSTTLADLEPDNNGMSYVFEGPIYSYGNYYNWYSATAGYGAYQGPTGIYNTSGDICPAGWHLPYGGTDTGVGGGNNSGGFYYLASQMGATSSNEENSNKLRSFPDNFVLSGYQLMNSTQYRNTGGLYWTATANNSEYGSYQTYRLSLREASINSGNNLTYNRENGHTVRCISGS